LFPNFGSKIHTFELLAGNIFKAAALSDTGAVFNFNEENHVIFLSYDIDLTDFGLPVAANNLESLLLQEIGDGSFGL
jgi:hypothetical protein